MYASISRLLLLLLIAFYLPVKGQDVFQHVSNKSIYSFLNEMANERIIELNSAVKPYSREFIAHSLSTVKDSGTQLKFPPAKGVGFLFEGL